MKDFYDVYTILLTDKLNLRILADAITSVFDNRGTENYENHPLFNGELKNDSVKCMQWKSFLKKMKIDSNLSFDEVVDYITKELSPYWQNLKATSI